MEFGIERFSRDSQDSYSQNEFCQLLRSRHHYRPAFLGSSDSIANDDKGSQPSSESHRSDINKKDFCVRRYNRGCVSLVREAILTKGTRQKPQLSSPARTKRGHVLKKQRGWFNRGTLYTIISIGTSRIAHLSNELRRRASQSILCTRRNGRRNLSQSKATQLHKHNLQQHSHATQSPHPQ
jgi:hypothetical protein